MKTFNQYIEEYFNTFPTDLSPVLYGKNLERMLNEEYELVPFELKIGLLWYVCKNNKYTSENFGELINILTDNPNYKDDFTANLPQKFIDNLFVYKANVHGKV